MSLDFIGAHVCDAWASARSFVSIHNPSDSGVKLLLKQITITHGNTYSLATSGFDLRVATTKFGTVAKKCSNVILDDVDSKAELLWGNCPASAFPSKIIYEPWTGSQFNDHTYLFASPIVIPPGYGLMVCAAHDNTYTIASFEGSEEVIE
jgi:hypothetical protein